jgi:hypothetical protein
MSKIHIGALAENGLIGIWQYSFEESGADQAAAPSEVRLRRSGNALVQERKPQADDRPRSDC